MFLNKPSSHLTNPMKPLSLLLLIASLCLFGCASSPKPNASAPAVQEANVIRDVTIRSAVFGSGLKVADVTPRVIHLLHNEPAGFFARRDWLHVDPRPYKNKVLLINYEYKGKPFTLLVTDQKVNYELLEEYAKL
jgi:hypothetical protein